jgi:hypothetical protein
VADRTRAQQLIGRLQERGWSGRKIAAALNRDASLISQARRGQKPIANLVPALENLARRKHVPARSETPKPVKNLPAKASTGRPSPPGTVRTPRAGVTVLARAEGRRVIALSPVQQVLPNVVPELERAGGLQAKALVTLADGTQVEVFKRGGWNAARLAEALRNRGSEFWESYVAELGYRNAKVIHVSISFT